MSWFSRTFKMDRVAAAQENEALFTPLRWNARRKTFPMYATAFGWGFLVTGLATGGQLVGLSWNNAILAIIIGNFVLVVVAGLSAIPGQQTGMGNSPVFKFAYGKWGFLLPTIILTLAVLGWQGATIGMVTSVWTGGLTAGQTYIVVSIIVGILGMLLTYYGISAIEKFAVVATFVLVIVGIYSLWYCIDAAGGYDKFVIIADKIAADSGFEQTLMQGITKVIGAWIAGSIICTELSRFAKSRATAAGMMIVGLPICQIFLNFLGYAGTVSFGTWDFVQYIGQIGFIAYVVALVAMTFALFSSLDTNLYFPAAMLSFVANIPRKGGVVIGGIVGILIAVWGLFAHYGAFLGVLGAIIPALAGPVIAEYFIMCKGRWDPKLLHKMPNVNWAAIIGYAVGIVMQFTTCPDLIPKEIWALIWAIIGTLIAEVIFKAAGHTQGYGSRKHLEVEPVMPQPDDSNFGDYDALFIHYDEDVNTQNK